MSRTDIHRPYWVQTQDPTVRPRLRANHHHWINEDWDPEQRRHLVRRTAPCTINDRDSLRCAWWPAERGNPFCGCRMCTGAPQRRHAHRRDRTVLRGQLAAARAAANAGHDDIDIPAPGPASKW